MDKSSPQPPAENPLKTLRLALNLTMEGLAEKLDVSRGYIVRVEQAVYPEPPTKPLQFLTAHVPTGTLSKEGVDLSDIASVYHSYYDYQAKQRRNSYGVLHPSPGFISDTPSGTHPFVYWREVSGLVARIGVSKAFCVHPAIVFKFESQSHLVQRVPEDLLFALRESGYGYETLGVLEDKYDTYKAYLRKRATSQS